MTISRSDRLVIHALTRPDCALSIVEVRAHEVVMSTGEVLYLRYDKLRHLCEWLAQNQTIIQTMRTWWTKDGLELIELHGGHIADTTRPGDDLAPVILPAAGRSVITLDTGGL